MVSKSNIEFDRSWSKFAAFFRLPFVSFIIYKKCLCQETIRSGDGKNAMFTLSKMHWGKNRNGGIGMKNSVITGAASGIGLAVREHLEAQGDRVVRSRTLSRLRTAQ